MSFESSAVSFTVETEAGVVVTNTLGGGVGVVGVCCAWVWVVPLDAKGSTGDGVDAADVAVELLGSPSAIALRYSANIAGM